MTEKKHQNSNRMAVILTACGGVLLLILMVMLIVRYRAVESELDRMLVESLTAHTEEAGEGAGYLLHYAETVLKNTNLFITGEAKAPEKSWVEPMVHTFNLVDDRMDLRYLDETDLARAPWGREDPELLGRVLRGDAVVSGILTDAEENGYVVAVRPVGWSGQTVGALVAQVKADTLLRQGKHSTFFHNVQSVIAGEDGRVVYGSSLSTQGLSLTDLGAEDGLTEQGGEAFRAAYRENVSGSFSYAVGSGRNYTAWAPVSYNGWRIVQFSQSPNVNVERTSMVQTVVMLVSLVVCAVLAALMWRQRARMAKERLRYAVLAEFKDTMLFEYNCEDDSMEFTSNALDTLEIGSGQMKGVVEGGESLTVFHPEDVGNVRLALKNAANMLPDQIEHDRIRLKGRDGNYRWYRSQYKAVFDSENRVVRVIGTLTDISVQIDREQELREQARQDPLTGLYNRAGVKMINARLEQISRGVLFMMDLDDFKSINDNFGHAAGDKLLTAIGRILTETFRTDDIVARVGGDEFVAFLSGSDNRATAEQKGQELLERVRTLRIEGIDTVASVSIGAASAPGCGRSYEALSAVADEALYQVKNSGKGGFLLK